MAYLGRKGASAPLTSADIPDNVIQQADIQDDAVGTDELANDVVINTSGAITTTGINTSASLVLTPGTTPGSPAEGQLYYNNADNVVKVYNGSIWNQLSNVFTATGGTESTYSSGGINYKVHTFTSSGTFTAEASGAVDYLVVAGGGSGGVYSNGSGYTSGNPGSSSTFSTITSIGGGAGTGYSASYPNRDGGSGGGGGSSGGANNTGTTTATT